MRLVYADIEFINSEDIGLARKFFIGEDDVRRMHLNMLADSGAYIMAINETIQSQLELPFIEKRKVQLPDSRVTAYDEVSPVNGKFANRTATCSAFVLPGDTEPLLGAIPWKKWMY